MDNFAQIAERIIEAQEAIIGPVAVEQAGLVPHLHVDWPAHSVSFDSDQKDAIDALVRQYELLFGKISVEVCKEAAAPLLRQLRPDQLPKTLV